VTDRNTTVRKQPLGVEGQLDQPALPPMLLAVADEQAVAHDAIKDVLGQSALLVLVDIVDQELVDVRQIIHDYRTYIRHSKSEDAAVGPPAALQEPELVRLEFS